MLKKAKIDRYSRIQLFFALFAEKNRWLHLEGKTVSQAALAKWVMTRYKSWTPLDGNGMVRRTDGRCHGPTDFVKDLVLRSYLADLEDVKSARKMAEKIPA